MINKREVMFAFFVVLSGIIIKISGFSINDAVLFQTTIISKMLIETRGMNALESLNELLKPFLIPFISLIIISISIGIISTIKDFKRKFILSLISSFIILIIFRSYMGFFFAMAVILSSLLSSKSINLSLVIFNLIMAIGIFVVVSNNSLIYENSFKTELGNILIPIVSNEVENIQNMTYQAGISIINQEKEALVYATQTSQLSDKDKVISDIYNNFNYITDEFEKKQKDINVTSYVDETIEKSQIFSAFIRWLPFSTALTIWILIEFLRSLFFRRIGDFTKNIIEKKNKK